MQTGIGLIEIGAGLAGLGGSGALEFITVGGGSAVAIPAAAGSLALIADGAVKVGIGISCFKNSNNNNNTNDEPPFSGKKLGNDPSKSPGEGFEWKGKGNPKSGRGSWVKGKGKSKETLHPDFNHPKPIKPHWDYEGPNFPEGVRLNTDGTWEPKIK